MPGSSPGMTSQKLRRGSFETRRSCAPQDEAGISPYLAQQRQAVEHRLERALLGRAEAALRHGPGLRPNARRQRNDDDLGAAREAAPLHDLAVERGAAVRRAFLVGDARRLLLVEVRDAGRLGGI